ncbi:hypothetical protein [Bradyrhizobium lablabi]|uniref:hypothetical protein n=1 Tax=Bradyrhizobium lablabi TaxID=722472 RepID=UPI0012AB97E2|nr:hypothetical protein [Bradyrhizobium lablabi]
MTTFIIARRRGRRNGGGQLSSPTEGNQHANLSRLLNRYRRVASAVCAVHRR